MPAYSTKRLPTSNYIINMSPKSVSQIPCRFSPAAGQVVKPRDQDEMEDPVGSTFSFIPTNATHWQKKDVGDDLGQTRIPECDVWGAKLESDGSYMRQHGMS